MVTWAHAFACLLLGVVQHLVHPPQPVEVRDSCILLNLPPLHRLGHPLERTGDPCDSPVHSLPHNQNGAR